MKTNKQKIFSRRIFVFSSVKYERTVIERKELEKNGYCERMNKLICENEKKRKLIRKTNRKKYALFKNLGSPFRDLSRQKSNMKWRHFYS